MLDRTAPASISGYLLCEAHVSETLGITIILFPYNCDVFHLTPLRKFIPYVVLGGGFWNNNKQSHILFLFVFRFIRTLITTAKNYDDKVINLC